MWQQWKLFNQSLITSRLIVTYSDSVDPRHLLFMAVASAALVKNNLSYLKALRAQRTLDATNKQCRQENLKCKYFDAIQQQKRQLQKRSSAVFLACINTSNRRRKLLHGLLADTEWRITAVAGSAQRGWSGWSPSNVTVTFNAQKCI